MKIKRRRFERGIDLYQTGDTIVAISTAPGAGAIGIVRLSGPEAFDYSSLIFKTKKQIEKKRQMLHGIFVEPLTQEPIDEGLLLWMTGPKSATGEDTAECQVHGSPAVLSRLVEILVSLGARPAERGEFTYRAFLNGRLDLTQAEAVQALVASRGEQERKQALRQLTGGLSAFLEPIEEKLKNLYLQIEARLEFPEDGIPDLSKDIFNNTVQNCGKALHQLLDSYARGLVLKDGLTVAMVGAPNVGKSSLLNALLGTPRAIVTHLPGTTRDVIEGEIQLSGLKVRLFDTAGIRETTEQVEVEGVRRTRQTMEEADLVLWIMDASRPEEGLPEAIQKKSADNVWWIFNKSDLASEPAKNPFPVERTLTLSCLTRNGIDGLIQKLGQWALRPEWETGVVLLQERHQREIRTAVDALARLENLIQKNESMEIWAEETKEALLAVGRVRGKNLGKEAFEDIFSRFCIGK
jgi:tRNA modification GTPase